jgi:DUF2934 family protein
MRKTQIDRDQEIRQLAYTIWQESGCPDGSDLQHWLKAEEIWLETHRPKKSGPKPAKAKKPRKTQTVK